MTTLTSEELQERLFDAIRTLKALPDPDSRFTRPKLSHWPDTLRERWLVWQIALERVKEGDSAFDLVWSDRFTPSKSGIDKMDEALEWLTWIDARELKIITHRAFGMSWMRIGWRIHANAYFAEKWFGDAMRKILRHLSFGTRPAISPRVRDSKYANRLQQEGRRIFA